MASADTQGTGEKEKDMKPIKDTQKYRTMHADIVVQLHEDGTYSVLKDRAGEFGSREERVAGLREGHRAWTLLWKEFVSRTVFFGWRRT